ESKLSLEPIKIGGEADEKKIPNSISRSDDAITSDIPSKDLSQYFIRGKGTDQVRTIDTDILDRTDDKSASIPEELVIQGYASSPKVDTEIIPKVSDEIDISETRVKDPLHGNNNNILQEIPNMTPYFAQPENNTSSLIEPHSHMRPNLEALPLPVVASTLMSPLLAYIFLALLIIAVVWFVRRRNIGRLEVPLLHRPEGATLGSKSHFFEIKCHKKSDRLRDMWSDNQVLEF